MKWKNVGIGAILLLICVSLLFLTTRPKISEFCLGTASYDVVCMKFHDQGRFAILKDPIALKYLNDIPKLKNMPTNEPITPAVTFVVDAFGRFGKIGSMNFAIDTAGRVIIIIYDCDYLSDPSYSYMVVDSNAPTVLRSLLGFLVDDSNRGRHWSDGHVY